MALARSTLPYVLARGQTPPRTLTSSCVSHCSGALTLDYTFSGVTPDCRINMLADDCSHAIVSTSTGPEYYVSVLSIVDKGQLEPGCTVLLHNKVLSVVGLLSDETDPMVSVMKARRFRPLARAAHCSVQRRRQ